MPVNIRTTFGIMTNRQSDLPLEFPDEEKAWEYLHTKYHYLNDNDLKEMVTITEAIPVVLYLPEGVKDKCEPGYVEKVFEFARSIHYEAQLQDKLDNFGLWCNHGGTTVELYNDFAPYSFYFCEFNANHDRIMNGGLIFHGAHDGGGNGGAPTFSVSLNPSNGWSIHT
jgi:hypothetical protein